MMRIRLNGKTIVATSGPILYTPWRNPQLMSNVMNESAPHARVSASDYMNNGFPDHKADLKHYYPAPSERHVLEEEIVGLKKEVIHTHSSRRVDRILEQIEKLTEKKEQLDLPEQSKRKATLTSANLGRDDQYDLRHE
jgi:hypothetical protein